MQSSSVAPMPQDLTTWIAHLYSNPELLLMGHDQRRTDLNLGLGWIYYAIARATRPTTAVVIGSYRGFVPLVLARALSDNAEGGHVTFIDPSKVDDFWTDPTRVQQHFKTYGQPNITHHLATTQHFITTAAYAALNNIGLLFIDGLHTHDQVAFDFNAFLPKLTPTAHILFHDSIRIRPSSIYGIPYTQSVKTFLDTLKQNPAWQLLDFPIADGLTLARRITPIPPYTPPVPH